MAGRVVLLDDERSAPVNAPWAGPLLALGARLARQPQPDPESRLVVALTVPTRDLAAALIATGWALTRPVTAPPAVEEVLETLQPSSPVRMVASRELVADRFVSYEVVGGRPRVRVGASGWLLEKVDMLLPAPGLPATRFRRTGLTLPGSLVTSVDRARTWLVAQVACGADVVLVGTKSCLAAEMAVRPGRGNLGVGHNSFGEILRPDDGSRSAWGSAILPAARFEEAVVPPEARLAVLDGSSAIGWLNDLTTDFSVAIIDRSVADDFAAESIIQLRSMGGTPVSLYRLGWQPPTGVEALVFEARR